jgi:Arc/MetJ-type ribon-helix-helix transcriptional regulator
MVRLSDDALAKVDQLVEATLFNSRSESTAYLVGAGIENQKELFDRLGTHTEEIRKLKEQLRKVAFDALKPKKKK